MTSALLPFLRASPWLRRHVWRPRSATFSDGSVRAAWIPPCRSHPHRKGQFAAPFGPAALRGRPVSGSARQWAEPRRRAVDHDDEL